MITAQDGGRPVGFTATSLNSVSADPPLLSFTIGTGASSWPAVRDSEYLGVHILGEHQRELAGLFARSGADRFGPPTGWAAGPHGVPVLDGVLAWLVCRVVARVPAGEHRVIIAEAVVGDPAGEGRPCCTTRGASTRCATESSLLGRVGRRWADHSSAALRLGGTHDVLTSNIPFGARAAPTGIRPTRRLCCLHKAVPEKTMR